MPSGYNPFMSGALRFPKKYKTDINKLCQRDKDKKVLETPFERIVDLWFLCVCLGVYFEENKEIKDHYRFMEGSVLKDDHSKIAALEIIAVGESKDDTIIDRPNDMLTILNGYAFGGIERVFTGLRKGNLEGLWNLSDYIIEEIRK